MTQSYITTKPRKGKHLTYSERCKIAVLKEEDYSNRQIAGILMRSPQTINNEMKRGTIKQLTRQKQNGKVYEYDNFVYDPDAGQATYDKQRLHCGRRPKWADTDAFIEWADDKMLHDKWSPDATVGFAKTHELFDESIMPCTTTLYQWIDKGMMKTTNMDLLEKLSRKPKANKPKHRNHKQVLGQSIEDRPASVEDRHTFGHWEIDTVVGNKTKEDAVLLTLAERQTRFEVIMKLSGKDADAVDQAVNCLRERAGDQFEHLFKTITSDNGSEFTGLTAVLQDAVEVYFSHPYASWERGTSENQHKLIRRFIPKGAAISEISDDRIRRIQRWMNDYPRKVLHYQTPHDHFVKAFKKERQSA